MNAWRVRLIRWLAGNDPVLLNISIEGGTIRWVPGKLILLGNQIPNIVTRKIAGDVWFKGIRR
jgi:hypothetical protein